MANKGDYGTSDPRRVRRRFRPTDIIHRGRLDQDGFDRFQLRGDGTPLVGDGTAAPRLGNVEGVLNVPDPATYGFYLWPPETIAQTGQAIATQNLRLGYFRAPVTQRITQIVTCPGGTLTPTGYTYAGYGIYSEDADGGLTLAGKYEETASPPTTIYDTAGTARTTALAAPIDFVRGKRYAAGPLVVFTGGSVTMQVRGLDPGGTAMRNEANLGVGSRVGVLVTAISALPATVSAATVASAAGNWVFPYCRFVP